MKAFLLAGGRGERLRPLTLSVPKCLAPVNGTPLLALWLDLLRHEGVTDVLLNVSHHVAQVRRFLENWTAEPRVHLHVEAEPRGTAGTVGDNRWFVNDASDFWVFYADTLTNVQLRPMLEAHRRHHGVLTVGLFHSPDPSAAGIVALADDGRIVEFTEKPPEPRGDLASAGIYLARPAIFDFLPCVEGLLDFGHHVLPRLVGNMFGYSIDDFVMDIGTPAALARAADAWARIPPGSA